MKVDGVATLQHYVPQFMLRNFKTVHDKKAQIFVLDKVRKKLYLSNIRNIAAERYFYNLDIDGEAVTFEDFFANLESETKVIIDKIITSKKLSVLTDDEKQNLYIYIAFQHFRTKSHRELSKSLVLQVYEKFKHFEIPEIKDFQFEEVDKKIKENTILNMAGLSKELLPFFQNKKWYLLHSLDDDFCIGDAPIVLRNSTVNPVFGSSDLGVNSKGVEIYLPISSSLCLSAICPSLMDGLEKARFLPNYNQPGMTILGAIENGSYFNIPKNFLSNLNQLQFYAAEQFLFARNESMLKTFFDLVNSNNEILGRRRMGFY